MINFCEPTHTLQPRNSVHVSLGTYHGYVFVGFINSCFRQGRTSWPFLKFDIYQLRVGLDQSFGNVALCGLKSGYRVCRGVKCPPLYGKTVAAGNYLLYGTASYPRSLESSAAHT